MKELNQEVLLDLYSRMTTIREFEKEAIELAKMNLTRAAIHTYNGEEAIGVGVCAHLTNNDYIVSNHRGHGHCIAKGADLRRMFAELMARETGYCKGKGGSMHIADMDVGMLGANGIVGGGIPIAIGAALAQKYLNKDSITVVFFGDGASNEGTFHESINMAAVNHLPVIFLCENNQYAISLNVKESTGCENIADRAVGYGIPGYILDGNTVVAVYNRMGEIVDHVRQYGGPVLVEAQTYRMAGHYFGDNENYRTREEVASWAEKCPILAAQKVLREQYGMAQEELAAIWQRQKQIVLDACEEAKKDPEPLVDDLENDLYSPNMKNIEWKPFVSPAQ